MLSVESRGPERRRAWKRSSDLAGAASSLTADTSGELGVTSEELEVAGDEVSVTEESGVGGGASGTGRLSNAGVSWKTGMFWPSIPESKR